MNPLAPQKEAQEQPKSPPWQEHKGRLAAHPWLHASPSPKDVPLPPSPQRSDVVAKPAVAPVQQLNLSTEVEHRQSLQTSHGANKSELGGHQDTEHIAAMIEQLGDIKSAVLSTIRQDILIVIDAILAHLTTTFDALPQGYVEKVIWAALNYYDQHAEVELTLHPDFAPYVEQARVTHGNLPKLQISWDEHQDKKAVTVRLNGVDGQKSLQSELAAVMSNLYGSHAEV